MSTFHIGVVGAGNMGAGIAQAMVENGLQVTLVDVNDESVQRGIDKIAAAMKKSVERGSMKEAVMNAALANLRGAADYTALTDADLVIEAVFEEKNVKKELFKILDKVCAPKTVFATNTSSFYVREMAEVTGRPDRVVGMHYFFPPSRNKLLEIIPHPGTSAATTRLADLIGRMHGKINILVADAPGFAVNRYFVPFLTCAVRLLEENVANKATIDAAAKKAFFIGMGPFELMNVTGIPITQHAANTLKAEISEFYAPSRLIEAQIASSKPWDLSETVDESRLDELVDFFYGVTLGVACKMVDEGVCSIMDCDTGAKIGLRWRFGPFELINKVGIGRIYKCVEAVSKRYPGFPMPENLVRQQKLGQPFSLDYVGMEVKNAVAYLKINRPEAMNALNVDVMRQLGEKFEAALKDDAVKAIAVTSAGSAFVAGADIKFFVENIQANTIDRIVDYTSNGQALLRALETSAKPTVAVVDGLSLGGGSELALACQAIVGTEKSSFGFPEAGIGIFPGYGGMIRLARIVGKDLAKYFVLTGKTIGAKDAQKMGIITVMSSLPDLEADVEKLVSEGKPLRKAEGRTVPGFEQEVLSMGKENLQKLLAGEHPAGLDAAFAEKMIGMLKAKAPLAVRMVDELMDAEEKVSVDEGIQLEIARLGDIFGTQDALTGLTAKRGVKIVYTGK